MKKQIEKIILELLDIEAVQHIVRAVILISPLAMLIIASELASRI